MIQRPRRVAAAAEAKGTEALSRLARAFFYAGARALLVSHQAVNSDATVKLITGAVKDGVRRYNRAFEAMRQQMIAMIDKGDAEMAQPALWTPFVVVGEGEVAQHETALAPMPAVTPQTPTVPTPRRQQITTLD